MKRLTNISRIIDYDDWSLNLLVQTGCGAHTWLIGLLTGVIARSHDLTPLTVVQAPKLLMPSHVIEATTPTGGATLCFWFPDSSSILE